jgi:adenine deaminase
MDVKPVKRLNRLIAVARGDAPADLLIRNTRLVNVFAGEVIDCDIAVVDGYVAGFGACDARRTVDLQNRYLAPGFIDAHVHIESAMVGPAQFARAVLPRGTTAVVADPHEIANVRGLDGIAYMLDASRHLALSVFFSLPSCVPATPLESAGAVLEADALAPLMTHPRVVALGEMMNFPGVISGDSGVLAKLDLAAGAGKPVDGHAPGVRGRALNAYLAAGIGSDHECTSIAEAAEKLAGGMYIMVREGSGARNLDALLPLITPRSARRMMWCTDDRHPHDLLAEGHIDGMVRRAVRAGLDPVTAIQMATLNPADYFGLKALGAVAPGRRADFVILDDLADPVVRQVYAAGRQVAEDGVLIDAAVPEKMHAAPSRLNVDPLALDFSIPARGRTMRVIEAVPDQIVTRAAVDAPTIRDGLAVADPRRDLLKIVVVERHHATGRMGRGFIRGFGLTRGALAATVAHDSHNLIAVGAVDADLRAAAAHLVSLGGGLVVVADGRVTADLPLPIAGLMSDRPVEAVRDRLDDLLAAARQLGCLLPDPFMTLSFMALPVIPALKLTDRGLVDVERFEIVPLFV